MTRDPAFACKVQPCDYQGGTAQALALHVRAKHPMELKPLPVPPTYRPLVGARRAVIYLRVSTIDQHPENQLPSCMTMLGLKGFSLIRECGTNGIYEDHGVSGKDMDRPALKKLIADAPTGAFDVVVFTRLSRLGRSLRDNIALWDYFQSLGIALVSVEGNYDTTTAQGRLVRNVMASVAEYQREELLEQQREGIERRRAEGKYLGRHPSACGVPVELGGLGPCPDGVDHTAAAKRWAAASDARDAKRERERLRMIEYRRRRQREAQERNASARARRSVESEGVLADGTDPGSEEAQ